MSLILLTFLLVSFSPINSSINSYFCDFDCKRVHTACARAPCPPRRTCGMNYRMLQMMDTDRDIVVDSHNKFRDLVATGKATEKVKDTASNMKAMSYSKELEFVAQCWANTCPEDDLHDECRSIKNFNDVGQNIFVERMLPVNYSNERVWANAFRYWTKDIIDLISEKLILNYKHGDEYNSTTQIIWAQTFLVGCGRTRFGRSQESQYVVVCNYAPHGNIEGAPIFEIGTPCSSCLCESKWKTLCGKVKNHRTDNWIPPFEMGENENPNISSYLHPNSIILILIVFMLF